MKRTIVGASLSESENGESGEAKKASVWSKVPDTWKAIGVVLAIAGTAIGGYATIRDAQDAFKAADGALSKRIDTNKSEGEKTVGLIASTETKLAKRIADLEAALGRRFDDVEEDMVRAEDLKGFVAETTLSTKECILTARAQIHEYQALAKAYNELLESIRIGLEAFSNRSDLTRADEEQKIRLARLESRLRTEKGNVDGNLQTYRERERTCEL